MSDQSDTDTDGLSRWEAKLPLVITLGFVGISIAGGTLHLVDWLAGIGIGVTMVWSIYLHDRIGEGDDTQNTDE